MSTETDTREQLLSGEVLPEHLTTNPESRIAPDLEVDGARGLVYCVECDRRVTRNSSNHKEYGHDTDCEYHEFAEVIRG